MFNKTQKVTLSDMIICLSRVMEWISPTIVRHQMRTAYIAQNIAKELGLSLELQYQLALAGMLHDIGAFSLKERIYFANYDTDPELIQIHAELGYQLLKNFHPFDTVAKLIRHHHYRWEYGKEFLENDTYSHHSQIILLAGMVDASICGEREILGQVSDICAAIRKDAGFTFVPEFVEAFTRIAEREYFWFNLESASINETVIDSLRHFNVELDISDLLDLSKVFSHLIDFQCHFTASHSSGVAGTAGALAKLYSFSETGCQMMKVAGYLHDIGKLTIPPKILNKPAKLTVEEFNIVKKHPFCTYRALNNIRGLEEINTWASFHHERIDSRGYPFRYVGSELPLGSRIVAVADVFTALAEDRPYRKGMHIKNVQDLLQEMVQNRGLDGGVVAMLFNNYQRIDELRLLEQADSARLYSEYYDSTKVKHQSSHYAL
ncbi:MAG TPA: HD domain-containing phosphohydrolase [Desulfuromonadaceae bacterium]